MARDRAVIDRAYPALDEARALATNDRAEYEAYVTLQTIGSADSLREIVRQSAELGRMRGVPPEGAAMTLSVADARAVLDRQRTRLNSSHSSASRMPSSA